MKVKEIVAKEIVSGITGFGLSIATSFLGGWDNLLKYMVLLVICDYVLGIINASVFKHSNKTENGGLSSKAGFRGMVKKLVIFMFIGLMQQTDNVLGTNNFLRNTVIYGFMVNELISIVEIVGLMGVVNLPPVITDAIELLKEKSNIDTKDIK